MNILDTFAKPTHLFYEPSLFAEYGVGTLILEDLPPIRMFAHHTTKYYVSCEHESVNLVEMIPGWEVVHETPAMRKIASMPNDQFTDDAPYYKTLVMCADILNAWQGYLRIEAENDHKNKNNRSKLTDEQMSRLKDVYAPRLLSTQDVGVQVYADFAPLEKFSFDIDKNGRAYTCHVVYDANLWLVMSVRFERTPIEHVA